MMAVRAATSVSHPTGHETGTSSAPDKAPEPHDGEHFNFAKQWWPLAIAENLDPKRPHAVSLMGKEVVLWKSEKDGWRCFLDRCPHRLAPLSEGRIEKSEDTLMCSYHGWTFDSSGKCQSLPQTGDERLLQATRSNMRSCAPVFPTKVLHDVIWVWADASPSAAIDSTMKEPGMPKEFDMGWKPMYGWFVRDVPMSFDMILENLMDPTHVPYAHHGVQGRRETSGPTGINIRNGEVTRDGGFAAELYPAPKVSASNPSTLATPVDSSSSEAAGDAMEEATPKAAKPLPGPVLLVVSFKPPSHVRYAFGPIIFDFFATPLRPGWSRVMLLSLWNPSVKMSWRQRLTWITPEWIKHAFTRNEVFDGDNYLLRKAEQRLKEEGGNWKKLYFMPTSADASVVALRRWFDRFAAPGAGPWGPSSPLEPIPRLDCMDRYSSHVVQCKACSRVLGVINTLLVVSGVLGVISLGLLSFAGATAAAVATAGWTGVAATFLRAVGPWGLLLAGCIAAALSLAQLRKKFYTQDYVHAFK